MRLTPLEPWICQKIFADDRDGHVLTREALEAYQMPKLRQTLEMASTRSHFYKRHLSGKNLNITNFKQFADLPFTTAEDIKHNPLDFLTVSQSDIHRVVTLQSSGTTGRPKRVYFTLNDQELTIDFFQYGISTLVNRGERVLILLPGKNPGSVGDLLKKALKRLGAEGIVYGPVINPADALAVIQKERIDCLVGIPVQVLSLAKYRDANGMAVPVMIKSVLLSTDYVPEAVVSALQEAWGCQVFNHYGSTEMGLGGALECEALSGYHLREADLYFEIVDPVTGLPLPDGEYGEVVFTTLTRQGMPLIRYKTGDLSRFLKEPCPCGTILKRLDKVTGRIAGTIRLANGSSVRITDLDEPLLSLDGIVDFMAEIKGREQQCLTITVFPAQGFQEPIEQSVVLNAVTMVPQLNTAIKQGKLKVEVHCQSGEYERRMNSSKRMIVGSSRGGE